MRYLINIAALMLVPLQSVLARAAGGGLFARHVWSRLPEILFAAVFGFVAYGIHSDVVYSLITTVWTFFAMEMGHGTFYGMVGYHDHNRPKDKPDEPRMQTLEYIVRPIYKAFGGNIYSPSYSWICMGVKGLLIGLPLAPIGLILAVLWPASYYVGHRIFNSTAKAEWISGAVAGFILSVAVWVI